MAILGLPWKHSLLPPANEVCEGYVFTRVCHSVHRGVSRPRPRVEVGAVWLGGCPGPHPGGPGGRGCIPACTETDIPQQTATAAGRMHPTAMHSCYYGWSFSFSLYCFDTEAGLTSQCCNKYLHYWQPANLSQTHTVQAEWGVYILNEYPTDFECIPYSLNAYPTAWMPTLQWPPNLDLSFRRFCTMHMADLLYIIGL